MADSASLLESCVAIRFDVPKLQTGSAALLGTTFHQAVCACRGVTVCLTLLHVRVVACRCPSACAYRCLPVRIVGSSIISTVAGSPRLGIWLELPVQPDLRWRQRVSAVHKSCNICRRHVVANPPSATHYHHDSGFCEHGLRCSLACC